MLSPKQWMRCPDVLTTLRLLFKHLPDPKMMSRNEWLHLVIVYAKYIIPPTSRSIELKIETAYTRAITLLA